MKNISFFIISLVFIFSSCKKEGDIIIEHHPNGNVRLKGNLNTYGNYEGEFYRYSTNGNLINKLNYINGDIITDTSYVYYPNGDLKMFGPVLKNNLDIGWWAYFNEKKELDKKIEFAKIDKEDFLNQQIFFDSSGDTIKRKSSYFKLKIPDTLKIGDNICLLHNFAEEKKVYSKELFVIINNVYSESLEKKDTFASDYFHKIKFRVYAHEKGKKIISGSIIERIAEINNINKDSAIGNLNEFVKFFKKEVYVKDNP